MREHAIGQSDEWTEAEADAPAAGHLHEALLERAASATGGESGHALGAFLVMRVVDHFAGGKVCEYVDALAYQIDSTREYLEHLQPRDTEANHLLEIMRVGGVTAGSGNVRLVWAPVLAYAYWLEQELRNLEALDVLETVLRTSRLEDSDEETAARYQQGRVLRKLSRYHESLDAFKDSAEMAGRLGDGHSVLSARIGRAIVLYKMGDLPESRRLLYEVICDAQLSGDLEAEARAHHDMANVLMLLEQPGQAVREVHLAYELYERPQQRVRALSDLGMAFKMLGHYAAADDALNIVLAGEAVTSEIRVNTLLELLHVAALTSNRVSFERYRQRLRTLEPNMNPDARIDFDLKLAAGFEVFDHPERAKELLRAAIARAEEHGASTYLFQAEEALRLLRSGNRWEAGSPARAAPDGQDLEVDRVADFLQALRAGVS